MIRCNQCHDNLQLGSAFKTSCQHVLCESCANKSFSTDCFCPICKQRLQAEDVAEILVGLQPAIHLQDNLFQVAFQDNSIPAILSNTSRILHTVSKLTDFVHSQIANEAQVEVEERVKLQKSIETERSDTTKSLYEMREQGILRNQQIQILEQQVAAKEEELDSLKEAYRTKLKKADAWEKAYYNIKEQVSGVSSLQRPEVTGAPPDDVGDRRRDGDFDMTSSVMPRAQDGYEIGRQPGWERDNEAPDDSSSAGRRCVYTKKTNITKTIRRGTLKQPPRVGAEPHKQWFPSQSSSHYFQKNLATDGDRRDVDENSPHNRQNRSIAATNDYDFAENRPPILHRKQAQPHWGEMHRYRDMPDAISSEVERGSLAGYTNMSRHSSRKNPTVQQLNPQPLQQYLLPERQTRPSFFDRDPALD